MIYYSGLSSYLKKRFGCKVYKLSLDGGFTCPNRDGTLGYSGCIFCLGGSGDFSIPCENDVFAAIENAKHLVSGKGAEKYIAYFQSFTGTYGPIDKLQKLYSKVIEHPDIVAVSIGTRPDCLSDSVIELLSSLNNIKPVWVELGLQTIHENTAQYIRRGYTLDVFDDAVKRLKDAGIEVIVHMILGLPGETPDMMIETARYIGLCGADGIKIQLLHVLEGTDLAEDYRQGKFETLSLDEYISILCRCIENIPDRMVVHRLTGDGSKRDLIAPFWSCNKKHVINEISKYLQPFPINTEVL